MVSEFIFQSFVEADAIMFHLIPLPIVRSVRCRLSITCNALGIRGLDPICCTFTCLMRASTNTIFCLDYCSRGNLIKLRPPMIHANDDQLWLAHLLLYHDFNVDEKYEDNWLLYLSSPREMSLPIRARRFDPGLPPVISYRDGVRYRLSL